MSYEGSTIRLLQDAAMIPLGNMSNAARKHEREEQATYIADALHAGITEKEIFLTLHDGKSGAPSEKVARLIAARKGNMAA